MITHQQVQPDISSEIWMFDNMQQTESSDSAQEWGEEINQRSTLHSQPAAVAAKQPGRRRKKSILQYFVWQILNQYMDAKYWSFIILLYLALFYFAVCLQSVNMLYCKNKWNEKWKNEMKKMNEVRWSKSQYVTAMARISGWLYHSMGLLVIPISTSMFIC